MKGNEFKKTMIENINRLYGGEEKGMTAFYRGAITALLNCGLMSDSEFWHYSQKLTDIELIRARALAVENLDALRQLMRYGIDEREKRNE